MKTVKIVQVGNSSGVVLSQEILRELGAERGDELYFTRAPEGDHRISVLKSEAARQLDVARTLMRRDHSLLRKLANK